MLYFFLSKILKLVVYLSSVRMNSELQLGKDKEEKEGEKDSKCLRLMASDELWVERNIGKFSITLL